MLLVLVVPSACGLEEYVYFYPASSVSGSAGLALDFSHSTLNNSIYFLGYEVQYRIYGSTAEAEADGSAIQASWSDISPDLIQSRLKAKKYLRAIPVMNPGASESADLSPPLVEVAQADLGVSIYALLNFQAETLSSIQKSGVVVKTFSLRRNELDGSGYYRGFGDFTRGADTAYADGVTSPDAAYLRAYVFAYGLDNGFKIITSRPTLLGSGAVPLTKKP